VLGDLPPAIFEALHSKSFIAEYAKNAEEFPRRTIFKFRIETGVPFVP
jgi:hypothetical protein